MTLSKAIQENKVISGILIALFGLLMSWGIWVTTETFTHKDTKTQLELVIKTEKHLAEKTIGTICRDIDELQVGQKEARTERKELSYQITKNHQEILLLLMNINKKFDHMNSKAANWSNPQQGKQSK